MAESPPGGREDQQPTNRRHRQLLMFEEEQGRERGWRERVPLFRATLVLMVLGAATLWGMRSCSAGGPEARGDLDTFTVPAAPPATRPAGRPASEVAPTEIEATVADTVELEVDARDESGIALSDTLLRVLVEGGTGTLGVDTVRTDSLGTARVLLTLAPQPDTTVIAAAVVGTDLPPIRITVMGRVGPPRRLAKARGDWQVTDAGGLLEGLAVRVTDRVGNPVPGAGVFFQPAAENGLVAPSRARTDSVGVASAVWRLGAVVGVQRLYAEVAEATIPSVTFSATALGDNAVAGVAESPAVDTAETSSPEPESAPVVVVRRPFAVGGTFACSIASGRAACRGANDRGQSAGGGGGGFQGLALGVSHACALDGSGAAWCWGANDGGQLGDGSRSDRTEPVRVETELAFSILTAGSGHTCGVVSDERAACWGRNLSGQVGDGTREDRSTPTLLPDGRSYQNLVAGWEHTCGLSTRGELACWGGNGDGQLGDGSQLDRLTPAPVTGTFGSVVAGSRHTCGISGEQVLCWGDNSFGQLGDGSTQSRTRPTAVVDLPAPPIRLAAGAVHTCALVAGGVAYCWGQNVHGQLGDGTNGNRATPSQVAGELTFASLFAGGALTCGFTTDASQYCWGLNQTGQLGDGTRDNRTSPVRVGR